MREPLWRRRRILGALAALPVSTGAAATSPALRIRLAQVSWGGAQPAEVESVLRSAAPALTRWFPGLTPEPILVTNHPDGPMVHYQRNAAGEIVMLLDTRDRFWCQYVHQFAHELCHVLCQFRDYPVKRHLWFEETLCATASFFVLRKMEDVWKKQPPFPEWAGYVTEFTRYAADTISATDASAVTDPSRFFRENQMELEKNPRNRKLQNALAQPLLQILEAAPQSWEAVAWLNAVPPGPSSTFREYLGNWKEAAPRRHQRFVSEILKRFVPSNAED